MPSRRLISPSSDSPLMSTSSDGAESRMLRVGIRLCPPARIFASGVPLKSAIACSSEWAFAYANGAGFTWTSPHGVSLLGFDTTEARAAARAHIALEIDSGRVFPCDSGLFRKRRSRFSDKNTHTMMDNEVHNAACKLHGAWTDHLRGGRGRGRHRPEAAVWRALHDAARSAA